MIFNRDKRRAEAKQEGFTNLRESCARHFNETHPEMKKGDDDNPEVTEWPEFTDG